MINTLLYVVICTSYILTELLLEDVVAGLDLDRVSSKSRPDSMGIMLAVNFEADSYNQKGIINRMYMFLYNCIFTRFAPRFTYKKKLSVKTIVHYFIESLVLNCV